MVLLMRRYVLLCRLWLFMGPGFLMSEYPKPWSVQYTSFLEAKRLHDVVYVVCQLADLVILP